jgi:hypothetical protein
MHADMDRKSSRRASTHMRLMYCVVPALVPSALQVPWGLGGCWLAVDARSVHGVFG